jgi:hypothetical protein
MELKCGGHVTYVCLKYGLTCSLLYVALILPTSGWHVAEWLTGEWHVAMGAESWHRWHRRCRTNHIWLDKMRFIWKNNLAYYGKSEEILSYCGKFDIWIFNKWYKHMVQWMLSIVLLKRKITPLLSRIQRYSIRASLNKLALRNPGAGQTKNSAHLHVAGMWLPNICLTCG